jgi:hypothetical protein
VVYFLLFLVISAIICKYSISSGQPNNDQSNNDQSNNDWLHNKTNNNETNV